jgi:hypothetical protein
MSDTLGSLGSVTAVFDAQTEAFDKKVKASADAVTASQRAIAAAAKRQGDAVAFAAKFAGDAVNAQSLRMVQAIRKEQQAGEDYRKIQAIIKAGYLGEVEGSTAAAAALTRLTRARMEAAAASKSSKTDTTGMFGAGFSATTLSLAGVAAITAELKHAVTASLEFGQEIQRASEKTGLAVGTLSTLHYAAAVTGGDFERMTTAVAKMDKTIGAATEGDKKASAYMRSLGLDAKELAGRTDGAEVAFRRFAQVLADTKDPIRQVQIATGLLGRAGADQISTLSQLGNNWDAFREKAAAAGVQLDGKTAESLMQTQERLKDLQQRVLGVEVAFTEGLTPGLEAFVKVLSEGNSSSSIFTGLGNRLAAVLNLASAAAAGVVSGLHAIAGIADGGTFTKTGREQFAEAEEWNKKAEAFKQAMVAGPDSKPMITAAPRPTGDADGFTGVGDLSNTKDKAAEEQMKAFELGMAKMKADHDVSVLEEYQYWDNLLGAAKKYPDNLLKVTEKVGQLYQEMGRKIEDVVKKAVEDQKKLDAASLAAMRTLEERSNEWERSVHSDADALARLEEVNASNALQMDALRVAHDESTGAITKHDAAVQMAALHAQEYARQLAQIQDSIDNDAADGSLSPEARKQKDDQYAARRATIMGEAARTSQQDQWNIQDSSVNGFKKALDELVNSTRDTAAMMKDVTANTLGNIDKALLADLTTGSHNRWQLRGQWKDVGKGMFSDVAGSALKKGEGSVLGAFGFGSHATPKGTAGDPLHVVMAGSGSGVASGVAGGVSGLTSGVGGFFRSVLSGVSIPGFADGGNTPSNSLIMVGERGPELMRTGSGGGTVIPNHKIDGMFGGGSNDLHVHVDARGSSNPAEVEAAANRAVRAAAPMIVAHAIKAGRDLRARLPSRRAG